MLKNCKLCNKQFKTKPSNHEKRIYCSRKCKGVITGEIIKKKFTNQRIKLKCKTCNINYYVQLSRKNKSNYCSNLCRSKSLTLKQFWNTATYEQKIENLKSRYENFVIKNEIGCWGWKGATSQGGYGDIAFNSRKKTKAHRAAWMIYKGPIPNGMCILHHCDNPPCSKIDHLFLGTLKDNNLDRANKGKGNFSNGEQVPWSKLKNEQVIQIKEMLKEKTTIEIAKCFNVANQTIRAIKHNKTWKHIKD